MPSDDLLSHNFPQFKRVAWSEWLKLKEIINKNVINMKMFIVPLKKKHRLKFDYNHLDNVPINLMSKKLIWL